MSAVLSFAEARAARELPVQSVIRVGDRVRMRSRALVQTLGGMRLIAVSELEPSP